MRDKLFAFISLFLLATTQSGIADSRIELKNALQQQLDQFAEQYKFPGANAAVALSNGEIITASTGFADLETKVEMKANTKMLAASIGKMFVAATILSLEDRGQLSQIDLVSKYLGDKKWFDQIPNSETMTIGHLLRHQAGLPDHPHLPEFQTALAADIASGENALTPDEVILFIKGHDPLFPSGEGWAYSDSGYILLGMIIEAVTEQSYYQFLTDTFLEPLMLTHTSPSNKPDIDGLAAGYTIPDNPFGLPVKTMDASGNLVWDPAIEWTGGGLASTAHDLALWGNLLFGGKVMETEYLARLLDGVQVSQDMPNVYYATGVAMYADTLYGPVYGHGGWIPGYVSSLRHYADIKVTITFQINTDVGIVDDSTDLVSALEKALAIRVSELLN